MLDNYKRLWIWLCILCLVPWNPFDPHELTCDLRSHLTSLKLIFNNEKRLHYLPSRVPAPSGIGGSFGYPEIRG
jgi:hypothetical protein